MSSRNVVCFWKLCVVGDVPFGVVGLCVFVVRCVEKAAGGMRTSKNVSFARTSKLEREVSKTNYENTNSKSNMLILNFENVEGTSFK